MIGRVGGDVFILCLEVLTLHVGSVTDFQRGLPKGVAVEVFRFYRMDVPCVARNLRNSFLLVDCLKLLVYLFRKVTE